MLKIWCLPWWFTWQTHHARTFSGWGSAPTNKLISQKNQKQHVLTKKLRNTSIEKWKERIAFSLEIHFSNPIHKKKTPTSCDGGPPMLIWLASVTSLICVRTLWFCSSTRHFWGNICLRWNAGDIYETFGMSLYKQFDFFVYISFGEPHVVTLQKSL